GAVGDGGAAPPRMAGARAGHHARADHRRRVRGCDHAELALHPRYRPVLLRDHVRADAPAWVVWHVPGLPAGLLYSVRGHLPDIWAGTLHAVPSAGSRSAAADQPGRVRA